MWVKQCHKPSAKSPHLLETIPSQPGGLFMAFFYPHLWKSVGKHQITLIGGWRNWRTCPSWCLQLSSALLVLRRGIKNDLTYLGQMWMMKKLFKKKKTVFYQKKHDWSCFVQIHIGIQMCFEWRCSPDSVATLVVLTVAVKARCSFEVFS